MEAKISNAKFFCDLVDAFKVLVGQGLLECSEKGIKMEGMDSGHISLNFFELNTNAFENYNCQENVNIGIDLNNLSLISKCAEPNDYIILEFFENADVLTVTLGSKSEELELESKKTSKKTSKNVKKQEFEFTLIDLDADNLTVPEMKYNMNMNIDTKKFKKMISTFMNVGSVINFKNLDENETESIDIQVVGDFCKMKETLYNSDEQKIECNGTLDCNFSLKYLNDFARASSLASNVNIQMSEGIPLLIHYDLCNNDVYIGSIKYYLAPKTDDDDE